MATVPYRRNARPDEGVSLVRKSKSVWILLIGNFIAQFGNMVCLPYLAIHLGQLRSVSPFGIGLIVGLAPLLTAFASFFLGGVSDRIGRRSVLLVCSLLRVLVFIGFAFARTPVEFGVLNAILGITTAGIFPVTKAMLSEFVPEDQRSRVFGRLYVSTNTAAVLGPLTGAWLTAVPNSSYIAFLAGAGLSAVYFATLFLFILESPARSNEGDPVRLWDALKAASHDRWLLVYLLLLMTVSAGYAQLDSTLPLTIPSTSLYGWLLTINAVTVIGLQGAVRKWLDGRSQLMGLHIGIMAVAAGTIGFGFAYGRKWGLVVAMVVFTVGEIFEFLTSNLILDSHAPKRLRGAYFGAMGFRNIGRFVGPSLGGWLLSSHGSFATFSFFGTALTIASFAFAAASLIPLRGSVRRANPLHSGRV